MAELSFAAAVAAVETLCVRGMCMLPPEVVMRLECAGEEETDEAARVHLTALYENAIACGLEKRPVCAEPCRAVLIAGAGVTMEGSLEEAARAGLARAIDRGMPYTGQLELRRAGAENTLTLIPVCPRSEGASFACELSPGPLAEQVLEFAAEALELCPHRACFPAFLGLGLGGSEDEALRMARDTLGCPIDRDNPDPELAELESAAVELLCAREPFGHYSVLGVNIARAERADFCAAVVSCHAPRRAVMRLS